MVTHWKGVLILALLACTAVGLALIAGHYFLAYAALVFTAVGSATYMIGEGDFTNGRVRRSQPMPSPSPRARRR